MRHLLAAILCALFVCSPVYTQDAPVDPPAVEEAVPEEAPAPEAPAPEADDEVDEEIALDTTPEPETLEEAVDIGLQLHDAVQASDYAMIGALALMLVVFVVRKYLWKSIPKEHIPLVTVTLAVLGEIAMALYAGVEWTQAIASGVSIGLAAIGGWEVLGKKLLKKPGADAEE